VRVETRSRRRVQKGIQRVVGELLCDIGFGRCSRRSPRRDPPSQNSELHALDASKQELVIPIVDHLRLGTYKAVSVVMRSESWVLSRCIPRSAIASHFIVIAAAVFTQPFASFTMSDADPNYCTPYSSTMDYDHDASYESEEEAGDMTSLPRRAAPPTPSRRRSRILPTTSPLTTTRPTLNSKTLPRPFRRPLGSLKVASTSCLSKPSPTTHSADMSATPGKWLTRLYTQPNLHYNQLLAYEPVPEHLIKCLQNKNAIHPSLPQF
jgi:hypothetical protein